MLELTGFLGLTRISFFLLTQIPLYCFVGGKSHRCFCVWAGSRGFHFAFGLTRISQIPQYRFVGGKSHRLALCVGWLVRIPLCFWAHTDLTDPTVLLCGWEISQMLLCVGGSCGFHFAFGLTRISLFGLTRISQIPQYRFVGGKSHR